LQRICNKLTENFVEYQKPRFYAAFLTMFFVSTPRGERKSKTLRRFPSRRFRRSCAAGQGSKAPRPIARRDRKIFRFFAKNTGPTF
jgi:hypothetical protein